MEKNNKLENLKKIVKNCIPNIVTGIIVAIFVPLITFFIESINEEKLLYYNLHNIGIGMSEQYMEECFGVPKYNYYDDENNIVENIYYTENEMIRAYFVDLKLEGYFITMLNKNSFGLKLPQIYSEFTNSKEIGKISYYEIEGVPEQIHANARQGYSRYFYMEEYYFAGLGRYNKFYFGYFDYGYETKHTGGIDENDEEVDIDKYEGMKIWLVDRKISCPNTYGICSQEYNNEIFNLVSNCYEFDWDLNNKNTSHP